MDLPLNVINATIRTDQLQAIYEKANDLVTNGVRVRYGDDTYIMKTSSVVGFLSLEPTQGGPGLPSLKVDQDALAYRISGIAETYVNVKPMDARFRMVNGTPTKVADAKQGVDVDVDGSVANVIAAVGVYTGGGTLEANLVVKTTAPNVTNADIASINTPDMLAYGQTTYASSSPKPPVERRAWCQQHKRHARTSRRGLLDRGHDRRPYARGRLQDGLRYSG